MASELIGAIQKLGEEFRFNRSIHRQHHLDQIETLIRKAY